MDDDFQHSISYNANRSVKKRRSSMDTNYESRRETLSLSSRPVVKDQVNAKERNESFQVKKTAIESLVSISHYRPSKQKESKDVPSKCVAFQCLLDVACDAISSDDGPCLKGIAENEGTVQMRSQERRDRSRDISNQSGDLCKRKRPISSDECQRQVNSHHQGQDLAFKVKKLRSVRCIVKRTFKADGELIKLISGNCTPTADSMSPLSSLCTENSEIPIRKQPIKIKFTFPAKETNVQHPNSVCGKENVATDMLSLNSEFMKGKDADKAKVYVKRKVNVADKESEIQCIEVSSSSENVVASILPLRPSTENCDESSMKQSMKKSVGLLVCKETNVDIKMPETKNVAARTESFSSKTTQINDDCIKDDKKVTAGTKSMIYECLHNSDDSIARHPVNRSVSLVSEGTEVHTRTPIHTNTVTAERESLSYQCPQNCYPNLKLKVLGNTASVRSWNRQQKVTNSHIVSACSSPGVLGFINIHDQSPTLVHRRVIGLSRRFRPPPLHPYLLKGTSSVNV